MTATLADVERAPAGTHVLVDGVQWEKTENGGLSRDGAVLSLMHFTGYLAEGRVTLRPNWQVGRWYVNSSDHWLIVRVEGNTLHVLRWAADGVDPIQTSWLTETPQGAMRLVAESEESVWMKRVRALHESFAETIPEVVAARLQSYAAEVDDGEFDEILNGYGIGRETAHVSSVRISGHTYWTPTDDECRAAMGDGVEVESIDDSVTIYWRKDVSVTLRGVGCTCDMVDRSMVSEYVPSCEDYEFEVECG